MRYLSVCSGIEAATVAWKPLGWGAVAFTEIDRFPSAVLAHHYPTVPNWGDLTKFSEWPDAAIDLLVGGTPCQSFSVAGLRAGLADPRGNLALTYLACVDRYRPRWVVWENVPGVLSADDGRAFGTFLGGLGQLGYGWAYRVLDAQYFGLAQRRARVFVVGHLGDWRRAAAVLFERESLSGHPAPRRETGQDVAGTIGCRSRTTDPDNNGAFIPEIVPQAMSAKRSKGSSGPAGDEVANLYRAPLIAFSMKDHGGDAGELAPTLRAGGHDKSHANAGVMPAIAFAENQRGELVTNDTMGALKAGGGEKTGPLDTDGHTIGIRSGMQVRRLTPRECERLQGFPDDYTLIPYRGKPAADGPRYKALGNSMAVPVMAWIGRRIQLVDDLGRELAESA